MSFVVGKVEELLEILLLFLFNVYFFVRRYCLICLYFLIFYFLKSEYEKKNEVIVILISEIVLVIKELNKKICNVVYDLFIEIGYGM